jgi:hypothetical protein
VKIDDFGDSPFRLADEKPRGFGAAGGPFQLNGETLQQG